MNKLFREQVTIYAGPTLIALSLVAVAGCSQPQTPAPTTPTPAIKPAPAKPKIQIKEVPLKEISIKSSVKLFKPCAKSDCQ